MSGNNDNKNIDYNNLSKKEQENISAQKAGTLGARAAADLATGGEYEKLRNAPVVGKMAQKKENKVGNKLAKADKATGGNIGKVAKPLNDSGAIDKTGQAMNMASGNPKANQIRTPQAVNAVPTQKSPNTNNLSNNAPGNTPNFARNGLNNDNNVPNGNSEGANKSRLRNIFDKRSNNSGGLGLNPFKKNRKSLLNPGGSGGATEGEQLTQMLVQGSKRVIKMAMIPIAPFVFMFLIIIMIFAADNSGAPDVAAVDRNTNRYGDTDYYANSEEQKEFYDRVNNTVDKYKSVGKDINGMYITATFSILKNKTGSLKYRDFTQAVVNELADAMLGGGSTYNKDKFHAYLKDTFFKKYLEGKDEDDYEELADDVFDYIEEYMKNTYKDNGDSCSSTTTGSCSYSFPGIVNGSGNPVNKSFSVSNLKVRLMSSTHSLCKGPNDNPMYDELVDFEDYVLGVIYGEIGTSMDPEVEKAHSIAARSFSLARGIEMNGGGGVKYLKEGNQDILQMRPCVADHLFCNTKTGCSANGTIQSDGNNGNQLYSDTNHAVVWKGPLSQEGNTHIIDSWEKTKGMVGVDKDGRVVEMTYWIGNGNKDDNVWQRWVKEKKWDYKQIILAAYPEIQDIKQANCSTTTESTGNGFLKTAKEIWTEITDTFTAYTNGNQVPPLQKTIDCSAFVSWVLYKYGYEDFKGYQKVTQWFVNTDLHEKYGWEEIKFAAGEDVTSKLKPGDILVRDPGNNNGHMNIIVEVRDDGSVWGYDCGDDSNWKSSKGGKVYNVSWFVKTDSRPGKIIRVTNQGTGGTCETAQAGEWSEWRQNGTAPWKDIKLGNSSETIGTVGCYVTSIAIQIARSGVKTNISNFNPGTFVTELNKRSNSFDGNGGLTGSGESYISEIVPGFKKAVNYVDLTRNKEEQIKTVQSYIDKGYYVLLHLDNGRHWVAVTGTTNDNIQMVDPGRNNKNVYDAYSVSSVVGLSVFEIK